MKIFFKILFGIVFFWLLIILLTNVFIEPWVGRKIQTEFAKKNSEYLVVIGKVNIWLFSSGLELENISIQSKQEQDSGSGLEGEIKSLKVNGINLIKILFRNDIVINELTISNINFSGNIPFSGKYNKPIVSPLNVGIGEIFFDKIDLALANSLNRKTISVKEGYLKVYELQIKKLDTITPAIISQFDFDADEFSTVSADSLYSYKASNIRYPATSNTLMVDSFAIHPNYNDYDFTSRNEFQTDRIEAGFSNIFIHNFSVAAYLKSQHFVSSYIEIGKMDLNVFRDNRKKFRHIVKPTFQSMIYDYPGLLSIDSIGLLDGNITYTEHSEKANEAGIIDHERDPERFLFNYCFKSILSGIKSSIAKNQKTKKKPK